MAAQTQSCPKYQRRRPQLTPCNQIVNEHLDSFVAERSAENRPLPEYVLEEFEAYLKCGIPAFGFLRLNAKGNKNDRADAEAIAEAATRPSMRFVPVKSPGHLDVQAIHRVRSRLVTQKAALTNEMRGFLFEHSVVLA